MLLLLIVVVSVLRLMAMTDVLLDIRLTDFDLRLVHIVQNLHAQLDILKQLVAAGLGKVLAHDDTQHLQVLGVRGHGVCGYDPATLAQLVGERELVVVLAGLLVQTECYEGQTCAALLRHDDEAELLERVREVVCGAGQVGHDGAVTMLAEADQLVVLADDLGGALGEVECEGGLVST